MGRLDAILVGVFRADCHTIQIQADVVSRGVVLRALDPVPRRVRGGSGTLGRDRRSPCSAWAQRKQQGKNNRFS